MVPILFQDKSSSCKQLLKPLAGVCVTLVLPGPPVSFLDPRAAPPAAQPRVAWGLASAVDSMAQHAEVSWLWDRSKTCRSVSCTGGQTSKVAEHAGGRTGRVAEHADGRTGRMAKQTWWQDKHGGRRRLQKRQGG